MSRIRRIIAGVSGRPDCLPALRYAADLARAWDAAFVPVHAWLPSGPKLVVCRLPHHYLGEEETKAAWQRLWRSVEMALGGIPPDARPLASRGRAGEVLVATASRAGDVLVIGTGRRSAVSRTRHGTVSRYCLAHSGCPVIAIPPRNSIAPPHTERATGGSVTFPV